MQNALLEGRIAEELYEKLKGDLQESVRKTKDDADALMTVSPHVLQSSEVSIDSTTRKEHLSASVREILSELKIAREAIKDYEFEILVLPAAASVFAFFGVASALRHYGVDRAGGASACVAASVFASGVAYFLPFRWLRKLQNEPRRTRIKNALDHAVSQFDARFPCGSADREHVMTFGPLPNYLSIDEHAAVLRHLLSPPRSKEREEADADTYNWYVR